MSEAPVSRFEPWRRRLVRLRLRVRLRQRARSAVPFMGGIAVALVALLIYQLLTPDPKLLTGSDVDGAIARAMASATAPPPYSAAVYQAIRPSFILIQTRGNGDDDESGGLGSGVVVTTRGDILTSLHVVEGAEQILVTFADGTQSPARIIAEEPAIDIAVLRATRPPAQIIPATLGSPGAMRIGDEAFVVGNPLGLYGSMSAGVISGFDRAFTDPDTDQKLEGLIQFDAAVNPGNSGGPLLNRSGQVIGIVTGLVNPTEQSFFIGIGFAVPITVAGGAAGMPQH